MDGSVSCMRSFLVFPVFLFFSYTCSMRIDGSQRGLLGNPPVRRLLQRTSFKNFFRGRENYIRIKHPFHRMENEKPGIHRHISVLKVNGPRPWPRIVTTKRIKHSATRTEKRFAGSSLGGAGRTGVN